uniref:Uncharacterized protein n=1 Tax=Siphoviridae sp. ctKcB20 TaxID=2827568 RepID=A0A8S5LLD4_9CAUD|nr:MAG TPA: hypothetical protein [Siphoviridae sp. ctKcB20]
MELSLSSFCFRTNRSLIIMNYFHTQAYLILML